MATPPRDSSVHNRDLNDESRSANFARHDFDSPDTLAAVFAGRVADVLRDAIALRSRACIALSGGTTPVRFFDALSRQRLEWDKVMITLVDERWVAPLDARSNEHLLREHLLRDEVRRAHFVPLYIPAPSPDDAVMRIAANVAALPAPFDCVVLGIGNDGHCASLFPDGDNLAQALDPQGSAMVVPMHSRAAGEPRITFTLPPISASRNLYLHMQGAEKNTVFDQVIRGEGALARSPLTAIMRHTKATLQVYWCA